MSNTATAPSPSATEVLAERFHQLCSTGKWEQAMAELYADDARHIEAMACPGGPYGQVIEGKKALTEMAANWNRTTTVHGFSVSPPLVNGDQFVCQMSLDCTSSEGPMAGQRINMTETCLYTARNGKIVEAKFFYPTKF